MLKFALLFTLILMTLGWYGAQDYKDWKALGPGGLPHTLSGWLTVTGYRIIAQDPFDHSLFSNDIGKPDDVSVLRELKPRAGSRPMIARHPVPHRQLDQHTSESLRESLISAYQDVVNNDVGRLVFQTSAFEKHNDAIWLRTNFDREIAHVHPSDGSIHAVLSPSDAKAVLTAERGELHPLVGLGPLSKTYTLLYAPRTEEELAAVIEIIRAAVVYLEHNSSNDISDISR